MRLLSFVPCGCRAGPIDDAPPAGLPADGGAAGAAARRRRTRARSLGGSPRWRPSLGDICEEYSAAADAAAKGARSSAAGIVPSRTGRSAARVLPRGDSDEYRHIETAVSMPAFAPAAFLF
ncbi:hypothetical protein GUJ93_ZPchr0008g11655 [Zizania palustris]|uniref:Uncharacterized protein n=1 Tax=Zizania palustris TaxID=103762 RepID=A0A8J5VG31_ZIZPA|nr:hypothetical protein GUJ93_ZPchr0008g11655 [Zizania palustris]